MFNIGWAELLVIGLVALIVIGPEDLPDMFRQLGRFTAKLRSMSREFSRAMEQAAKDSGVKDVATDLTKIASPKAMGLDAVKSAADKFEKWDPMKGTGLTGSGFKPLVPPPMPATPKPVVKVDDVAEAAEDNAEAARQVLRAAVLAEQAAKLRAIDEGSYPEPVILPPVVAPKPVRTARVKAVAAPVVEVAAKPEAKPRKAAKKAEKA